MEKKNNVRNLYELEIIFFFNFDIDRTYKIYNFFSERKECVE
jgi:hypothetical protein